MLHVEFGLILFGGFGEEDFEGLFLKFHIWKTDSAPWRPCFLTEQNSLNNFDRQLIEESFCEKSFQIHALDLEKKIF